MNLIDDTDVNYNKKKSKRYKIYFRLEYSNDYLKENILKQNLSFFFQYYFK